MAAHASGSTLTVTSTDDSGPGSLRQAIADAMSGDTIEIGVAGAIALSSGSLVVMKDLTIVGPGAAALAIDAQHASRVFAIGSLSVPVTVAIRGVTLLNGAATSGGAIVNYGTLQLIDAVLSGNRASNEGGAIFNAAGKVYLAGTVVSANTAMIGAAVSNRAYLSVERSTISRNAAEGVYGGIGGAISSNQDGGGYVGGTATTEVFIRDSLLTQNTASLKAGAIFNGLGRLTMVNTTIAANVCSYAGSCQCWGGGGIFNSGGDVRVIASTIAVNAAATAGGAITNLSGTTTLKATILAKAGDGPNCYVSLGGIVSQGYNISDDSSCAPAFTAAGDRNDTPAGLSPMGLQDNGGPTGTWQLVPGAAALDAVPASECVPTDQRGVSRPQGAACDAGAYERVDSPYAADIQMPIKADGSTVFNASRGVIPVKFTLSASGTPACDLPHATIAVARLAGDSLGPVSEAPYELPADVGGDFRVGACQYVYNLAVSSLTAGTYWVSISIDGEVVGTATFGIR